MIKKNKDFSREIGRKGERVAAEYLIKSGYKILEKNYTKPWGEIDIIAKINYKIVFFEVKTFNDKDFLPEENITPKKKKNLTKSAMLYLQNKNISSEWQIDVIGIEFNGANKCKLRHTKNIF
jgi:putative endonuclease